MNGQTAKRRPPSWISPMKRFALLVSASLTVIRRGTGRSLRKPAKSAPCWAANTDTVSTAPRISPSRSSRVSGLTWYGTKRDRHHSWPLKGYGQLLFTVIVFWWRPEFLPVTKIPAGDDGAAAPLEPRGTWEGGDYCPEVVSVLGYRPSPGRGVGRCKRPGPGENSSPLLGNPSVRFVQEVLP